MSVIIIMNAAIISAIAPSADCKNPNTYPKNPHFLPVYTPTTSEYAGCTESARGALSPFVVYVIAPFEATRTSVTRCVISAVAPPDRTSNVITSPTLISSADFGTRPTIMSPVEIFGSMESETIAKSLYPPNVG